VLITLLVNNKHVHEYFLTTKFIQHEIQLADAADLVQQGAAPPDGGPLLHFATDLIIQRNLVHLSLWILTKLQT
jgi:hypothetical protein